MCTLLAYCHVPVHKVGKTKGFFNTSVYGQASVVTPYIKILKHARSEYHCFLLKSCAWVQFSGTLLIYYNFLLLCTSSPLHLFETFCFKLPCRCRLISVYRLLTLTCQQSDSVRDIVLEDAASSWMWRKKIISANKGYIYLRGCGLSGYLPFFIC